MNELQQEMFAADVREGLLEVGIGGFKAHSLGLTEAQMLAVLASAMEDLVQSIVRARAADPHVLELEAAVDRVRRLHHQDDSLLAPGRWCPACGQETPCSTIRALREPA